MTKREIWESYGLRRIWKPSDSCKELTEEEEKAEHERCKAAIQYFEVYFEEQGNE